jgi:hypothetical protein
MFSKPVVEPMMVLSAVAVAWVLIQNFPPSVANLLAVGRFRIPR